MMLKAFRLFLLSNLALLFYICNCSLVFGLNVKESRIISPSPVEWGQFGQSIAANGELLAISAPGEDVPPGGVTNAPIYLYNQGSDGTWARFQTVYLSNSSLSSKFSISEEWLMVAGSPLVVFRKQPDGTFSYYSSIADPSDGYGITSVAVDNSYAVLACQTEPDGTKKGTAYIYAFNAITGNWTQQAKLVSPSPALEFGLRTAIDGDYAAVSALAPDPGSVSIYRRSGTAWSKIDTVNPPSSCWGFGMSIDIKGTDVLVGMVGRCPDISGWGYGGALLYKKAPSSDTWLRQAVFSDPEDIYMKDFGNSVAIGENGRIFVGKPGPGVSSVVVFNDSGSGITIEEELVSTNSDSSINDAMGTSIALIDDTIIAGAYAHAPDSISYAGGVFAFRLSDGLAGDIDNNGTIELTDAILSLQFLSGVSSVSLSLEGDANNDQHIGLEESIFILNALSQ